MSRNRSALPTPTDKARAVEDMFDRIAPKYDRLNRILTLGLDQRWRTRAVELMALPTGSTVLDLACGTGDLCIELERQGHLPIGIDVSAGMLSAARWSTRLVRADVLAMPAPDASIDGITCGFALRNLVGLEPFFAECARTLRKGGRIAILEVAEPENALFRFGHSVYFRKVVPFVGGLLSDRDAYRYLPESTAYLPPGDGLVRMMEDAGFVEVDRRLFGLGASQLLTGTRR